MNWKRILRKGSPKFRNQKKRNFNLFLEAVRGPDEKARNKPLQLFLEITTSCNLKCRKCGKNFFPDLRKVNQIPFSLLVGLRDYYQEAFEVNTFGCGEMFLYPDLKPLVKMLKTYGCKLSGVTNGMAISVEDIGWLVANRYDELTFSIDGADPETMRRLRGGADLEKIITTLSHIREKKRKRRSDLPRLIVNFVAQRDNVRQLPDMMRILSPLGIYFVGINALHGWGGEGNKYYDEYRLAHVKREEFETILEESRILAEKAGIRFSSFVNVEAEWEGRADLLADGVNAGKEAPGKQDLPPYYCYSPWTTLYLSADRTTKVCCFMGENLGLFSNVSDLDAIWQGDGPLTEIRKAVSRGLVHPACRVCVEWGRYRFSQSFVNTLKEQL